MTLPNMDAQKQREAWLQVRDGLLKQVDALERMLDISPRTAEIRKAAKFDEQHEQMRKSLHGIDSN